MAKRIQLTILDSGVTVVADLYEDLSPRTVAAMWQMLEKPYEARTVNSKFAGRKITLEPPPENRTFDPEAIPSESMTVYPLEGNLLWNYVPPRSVRGMPNGMWDVMVIYGPEVILRNPAGQIPSNLWGHITENMEAFAAECADGRISGAKTVRLSRLE